MRSELKSILLLFLFLITADLFAETGQRIVLINFEGNRKVDADAIIMNIQSREGEELSLSIIARDIKNIYKMGYFESIMAETEEIDGGIILTFVLKEKQYVRSYEIEGNDEIETDKIREKIKIKPRSFLDEVALKSSLEGIESLYSEEGLFLAEIETEFTDLGSGEILVKFKIDEGEKVRVKKIYFPGISESVADELRSTMETKEVNYLSWLTSRGKYRREVLDSDITRIESYYMDRGYINVKIDAPIVSISEDRKWIYISISVNEGERFKISRIDITGELLFDREEMIKEIKSEEGEYFNRSKIGQDIFSLTELYGRLGYANANINPLTRLDLEKKTVDLTLNIEKNKLVYIDRINLEGNTKTRDKVIRRELKLSEGELYNIDKIKLSRERIYALGFFEEVDFSTKPGVEESTIDLNINVKEGNTGTLTAGAGFSSIDQFIFTAQMSLGNFLGYGQRFAINTELSSRRQIVDLSFYEPYFLDTDWSFGVQLFTTERSYIFQRKSTGGSLRWGYLVGDYSRLFVQYKYEDIEIKDIGATDTRLFTSGVSSSVVFSLVRDSKNHPYDPSKGSVSILSLEVAGKYIGSEFDFTKMDASYSKFIPLFFRTVLVLKAQAGYGRSMTRERLPFSERYFLGGPNDVRGYDYWTVGPMEPVIGIDDEPTSPTIYKPIGGNKMVVLNAEYLFNILRPAGIKGVFFFDAGNAYKEEEDFFQEPLRLSWGFGIRWFTPIAPFRFEWGFPINRRAGERASVFEFSIGTFF